MRALTSDGRIRLSALDASPLWDGVRRGLPQLGPGAAAALVELISGAALLQSRTLLAERVQLVLRSSGRAKAIVADAWPDGGLRGLLDTNPDIRDTGDEGGLGVAPMVAPPGNFQVMRSNPKGSPYIGTLELAPGPISAQVELYLQQSEQVQACVVLWCDAATGHAGGLLVEPLPFCPPHRLGLMLAALDSLDVAKPRELTPDFLVAWVNQGEGAEVMSSMDLEYRCRCSRQSLIDTLSVMPSEKRDAHSSPEEGLEARCEYCGKTYTIARRELRRGGDGTTDATNLCGGAAG